MYRKILIPVQEPSEVEPLIRFAAMLLETDGEIRVLHVIPTTTLPEVTREWRASVRLVVPAHEAGAALDVRVDPEVRAATDVPGEILESAETADVDAILLTLRGDKRKRNPFVGHTASGILHHARSDVVVVNRLGLAAVKVPRILLPTPREAPTPTAMRVAEDLAVHFPGAPVVAITLSSGGRDGLVESIGMNGKGFRGVPIGHKRSIFPERQLARRHRLPEVIVQAAQRERYGLVIVGEEAEPSGSPMLTRRFLEDLFRAAPCPVLAIRG